MATVPMIPGQAGGRVTGAKNNGMPVLGGQTGLNQFSPMSGIPNTGAVHGPTNGVTAPITSPVASAGVTGRPPSPIMGGGAMAGAPPTAINTPPQAVSTGGATGAPTGATPAGTGGNATLAGYTPQQTQQLQKQLNDIYGKGEGGLLGSLLMNLGSNDSSYMDAYHKAMSKSTAEGLATLQTAQGNAGISANSSAAAIESANYMSGVTAQEGLQEQQLIQTQQKEAINLAQGMQQDAVAENSTSWLNTLSSVVDIGATAAGAFTGMPNLGGLFGGKGGSIPNINSGTGASILPGAISGSTGSGGYTGPMPLSIG